MGILRRVTILLLLFLAGPALADGRSPVLLAEISGVIGPASADSLTRSLETARARQAAALILRIDTPGGLQSSMRSMVGAILASPVPVLCLVGPSGARAASAGTYLLYSCAFAAMAPGTTVGAATPVSLGGSPATEQDPHIAKAVNDAAAFLRGLADLQGRNAVWAEKAVREAATLTADEALRDHVADAIASDGAELLAKADGRSVMVAGHRLVLDLHDRTIEILPMPWPSRLLALLTQPEVAYLLMLVGILGVFLELSAPGQILPGLMGAVSLLVAAYGLALLPLDFTGVALLLLGIGLMAAEPFVLAHGVIAVAGIIAFAVGSLMMFDAAPPLFRLSIWVVAGASAGCLLVLLGMLGLVVRAQRRRIGCGGETLPGRPAVVIDWNGTGGHVRLDGDSWEAQAAKALRPGQTVPGQTVIVSGRQGLRLEVTAADELQRKDQ